MLQNITYHGHNGPILAVIALTSRAAYTPPGLTHCTETQARLSGAFLDSESDDHYKRDSLQPTTAAARDVRGGRPEDKEEEWWEITL